MWKLFLHCSWIHSCLGSSWSTFLWHLVDAMNSSHAISMTERVQKWRSLCRCIHRPQTENVQQSNRSISLFYKTSIINCIALFFMMMLYNILYYRKVMTQSIVFVIHCEMLSCCCSDLPPSHALSAQLTDPMHPQYRQSINTSPPTPPCLYEPMWGREKLKAQANGINKHIMCGC